VTQALARAARIRGIVTAFLAPALRVRANRRTRSAFRLRALENLVISRRVDQQLTGRNDPVRVGPLP
jgi:hypothetical protein